MKERPLLFVVALLVLVLGLVAACRGAEPTPTPVPPTPTPTATPDPTPTPTPTPTAPDLDEIMAQAEQTVVRLTSGNVSWNGVMIDPSGLILTSSRNLGSAPLANYRTFDGQTGTAWVIGRDDGNGARDGFELALLRIHENDGPFEFINVEPIGVPQIDESLILLNYSSGGNTVEKRSVRVLAQRPDLTTGIRYIQLQAPSGATAIGGLLIDEQGRFRGIRMSEQFMVRLELGQAGEVYAMDANGLANQVIPRLEEGVMLIREAAPPGDDSAPPPLPAIFHGSVNVDGQPLPAGSRIYARVVRSNQPDQWFTQLTTSNGSYVLTTPVLVGGYSGATVEFWYDARMAVQTSTYNPGGNTTVNLTFE